MYKKTDGLASSAKSTGLTNNASVAEDMKINLPTDNFISFKSESSTTITYNRDCVFDGRFSTRKTNAAFKKSICSESPA